MLIECGKKISIEVNPSDLPQTSLDHAIKIGLKNILQDAHAGVKDPAEARAKAEKKLQALLAGEVRAQTTRTTNVADKVSLMRAIATVWETRLEDLSKLKAGKRDAEARRLAKELLDKGNETRVVSQSTAKPVRRVKAA